MMIVKYVKILYYQTIYKYINELMYFIKSVIRVAFSFKIQYFLLYKISFNNIQIFILHLTSQYIKMNIHCKFLVLLLTPIISLNIYIKEYEIYRNINY